MGLSQYRRKRDFSQTPEPAGNTVNKAIEPQKLYVIQKHAASHLHYDFRLELEGVLKSWAVPKGPSLDPKIKRLAMHVEDHPLEYGHFEGIIPKGQYGGGTVMLWDQGTWEPLDEFPLTAYKRGHLRFVLHGEKLKGRWDLLRFKDDKHWFLIKYNDNESRPQDECDVTTLNRSVLSNQLLEDISNSYEHIWGAKTAPRSKKTKKKVPKSLTTSSRTSYPGFIAPQLATLVNNPPKTDDWLHEIKLDGYRIEACKQGTQVTLRSRNNLHWTSKFPQIALAVEHLAHENIILDGEIIALDKDGHSNFQLLQNFLNQGDEINLVYFIFDILYLEHYDLRELPLLKRKEILQQSIPDNNPLLHINDYWLEQGDALYTYACEQGLEGIISKKKLSPYCSRRSKDWVKVKCNKRQEFIICGYSPPQGTRAHFGSLYLGVFNKKGTLDYTGNVGTGFTEKSLTQIFKLLQEHRTNKNPFNFNPEGAHSAHWVKPLIVCEVEFTEWTDEGHLRHPSFKGLRMDKKAKEVVREQALAHEETPNTSIKLSNPNRELYPEDHITKEELLEYYSEISPYILPHIQERLLTIVRCPSNFTECFYQRHYKKSFTQALHPFEDPENNEDYFYLNDTQGLLELVQLGVLEIHPWGSTIQHLEQPDRIIFDLDPAPDIAWSEVVAAAVAVKNYLIQCKLTSFVKTTGGKGLHVVVPIIPEYNWAEVKEFTQHFVQLLEQIHPELYVSKMTKKRRTGKIYIDYLRNQRTATAVAAYSTRARPHAPLSTPLGWDELSNQVKDNTFTLRTLPQRLSQLKKDPWHNFWRIKQSLQLEQLDLPDQD
ncbi:MAG: DNA ligase D [Legionella sp.]|nr:DNA ligase D [Legionella sp.]